MAISSTSYPNQKNRTIPPKVMIRKFQEMLENAMKDPEILCFQDACLSIGCRSTKIDYWVNKMPVFESYKKEIQNVIISRINNKALNNKFNATQSIWRQKQLGERDTQYQNTDITSKGDQVVITPLSFNDKAKK